ncbi:MAG: right-handed parallel beta-helix repeat-containing protein [Myxococcota bacterium]
MWWMAALAHGASVTVSPGDDVGVVTSSLLAGDTVTFTAGTFELEGTVTWEGLGESANPIRIVGAPDGGTVLRSSGGGYVARVVNSAYVDVSDIIFEGVDPEKTNHLGFQVADSTNVTVTNCVMRNVRNSGLRIEGDTNNIRIALNEVGPVQDGGGIVVGCPDGGCWMQDSLVENNLVHDVGNTGLLFYPGTQAVEIFDNVVFRAGADGLILPDTQFGEQNVARGNAIWQIEDDGIDVYGPALVQNNVIFETGDEGIFAHDEGDTLFDVQISHNTVARTNGYGAFLRDWFDREGLVFANNVLSNSTGRSLLYDDPRSEPDFYKKYGKDLPPDTTNFISNNVVTGLIEGFDVIVRPDFVIEGGGVADFMDIDNFDFYLSPGSRARDAGTPLGEAYIPIEDFNRVARDGASPDAGAYEWVGSANTGWIIAETFKDTAPARPPGTALGGCCNNNDDGSRAWMLTPLLFLAVLRRRRAR